MSRPTDFGIMDEPADWVVCWDCKGERRTPSCLAGSDCPHQPRCTARPCRTCGGEGGWRRAEIR